MSSLVNGAKLRLAMSTQDSGKPLIFLLTHRSK